MLKLSNFRHISTSKLSLKQKKQQATQWTIHMNQTNWQQRLTKKLQLCVQFLIPLFICWQIQTALWMYRSMTRLLANLLCIQPPTLLRSKSGCSQLLTAWHRDAWIAQFYYFRKRQSQNFYLYLLKGLKEFQLCICLQYRRVNYVKCQLIWHNVHEQFSSTGKGHGKMVWWKLAKRML